MYYIKWGLTLIIWALVAACLYYTLPRYDVVRITNTEVRRIEAGANSIFWANPGTSSATNDISRDIFFVDAFRPNNRPRVYRNEDTGWGWPPYFKLNSANLQAEIRDKISTRDNPSWVALRYYGWRFEPISIYPNVVGMRDVDGPDVQITNWFNIIFLTCFVLVFGALWIRWRRFRERRIDPVLERMGDDLDAAGDAIADKRRGLRRWLQRWN
ncbi:MAG: DUF1523 family protein [Marinibacterium sp.]|nr:DUF1523 family protein [Marinibacterium sp.]